MSDTIREQILSAIETAAANLTTAYGYNISLGSNVLRHSKSFDSTTALIILPQNETVESAHGAKFHTMPVKLEGYSEIGSSNHYEISEQILGDLIEFMTANTYTMAYTSGGTYVVKSGDTITGHTSSKTAKVISVTVSTGSWAGGDAAGNLTLRRKTGSFTAENLDVGTSLNVATVTGSVTGQSPITRVTGGYAKNIDYQSGGIGDPPDGTAEYAGAWAIFNIYYETLIGNPYGQP